MQIDFEPERKKQMRIYTILQNIKDSDIQFEKAEKNLVIISYPSETSGPSITRSQSIYFKQDNQWKKTAFSYLDLTEFEFVYLDEDNLPDVIAIRNCCAHITVEALLSNNLEQKIESNLSFFEKDFKFKTGKCDDLLIEGFVNRTQRVTKYTFDCKEKKFREIKSFWKFF